MSFRTTSFAFLALILSSSIATSAEFLVLGSELRKVAEPADFSFPSQLGWEAAPNTGPIRNAKRLLVDMFAVPVISFRGQREANIYTNVSPSVVYVVAEDRAGFGVVLTNDGLVITNWHVVDQADEIVLIFKPSVEGAKPTTADIAYGKVVKVDEISDLALIKTGKMPARLKPVK